jgi:hypothetical protein
MARARSMRYQWFTFLIDRPTMSSSRDNASTKATTSHGCLYYLIQLKTMVWRSLYRKHFAEKPSFTLFSIRRFLLDDVPTFHAATCTPRRSAALASRVAGGCGCESKKAEAVLHLLEYHGLMIVTNESKNPKLPYDRVLYMVPPMPRVCCYGDSRPTAQAQAQTYQCSSLEAKAR